MRNEQLFREDLDDLSHVRPYPPNVFVNYLCSTEDYPRTRPIVSKSFQPVELRYRYTRELVPYISMFSMKRSRRWMQRMLFWLSDLFRKRDLSTHRPSGYTLVLQKDQDA